MDNQPGSTSPGPDTETSGDTGSRSSSPQSLQSPPSTSPKAQAGFAIVTQVATWAAQGYALFLIAPEVTAGFTYLREKSGWASAIPLALALLPFCLIVSPLATLKALNIATKLRQGKGDAK